MWNTYRIGFKYSIHNPTSGATIVFHKTEYIIAMSRAAALAKLEGKYTCTEILCVSEF